MYAAPIFTFLEDGDVLAEERLQKGNFLQWKARSAQARSKETMSLDDRPWTSRLGERGVPWLPRVQDLVDVCFCRATRLSIRARYLNVSQDLLTATFAPDGEYPPTGHDTCVYSYEYDRVVSSRFNNVALGWPSEWMPGKNSFSETDIRDFRRLHVSALGISGYRCMLSEPVRTLVGVAVQLRRQQLLLT